MTRQVAGDPADREWSHDRKRFAADGAIVGPLARQLSELAQRLAPAPTVADAVRHVVEMTKVVVPAADLVSVTLRDPRGKFRTPFHTDALAVRLDELQYEFGEGPCVEATRTPGEGAIDAPDVATSQSWPRWGPPAAQLGVRSVFAVGLFPYSDPPRMGALNIYSSLLDGLAELDRDVAIVLASFAAAALSGTDAVEAAKLESVQLREALLSRDLIGQAKGILMERRGCSADEAFDVLRRTSQDLNLKLSAVAEAVVAHQKPR
ncbi:ANTAR domain-containing protein [Fodinicola acaciae]|uniref:ANTAR domain-containing protein n=1 Tax=Fodinicola acaciae TaxID=2681555 RepID=UPI001C9E73E7|nr:ANTAR domain-containing protein [Fodinicola acaciae]